MIPLIPMVAGGVLSDIQGLASEITSAASTGLGTGAIGGVKAKASFTDTLKTAIDRVNSQVATASGAAASYAAGNHAIPLSSVMVSLEKANLAFQTAVSVRDRVTEAYSSIMNMQV
ncbi:MAG TPA: flagellar hook-basal body complex protein FliE [Stellaceae bacterium]